MTGSSTDALSVAFASQGVSGPAWLNALRQDAFARFATLGVPTRQDEEWKYTSLRGFDAAPWVLSRGETTCTFGGDLPHGVRISSVADVLATRPELLKDRLATHARSARAFEAANAAFVGSGVVVEVAKGVVVPQAIHIRHNAADGAFFPRVFLALGAGAEASVVETFAPNTADRAFTGSVTDIMLGENAKLSYVKVQTDAPTAYHVSSTRAIVPRAAVLKALSFAFGGQVTRNDLDIVLTGEGADATLDGFYLVTDKRHVDNHSTVDHTVPHTTSSQLYKGILAGQGRAVFNGKVFVRQDAQKTSAFQLNQNLLLSSEAEIDTKPQLEIDADDVKCAHGAAVGQLNADEIFYLESRAIPRAEAIKMLSLGFADEVLMRFEDVKLREELRQLVRNAIA